MSKAQTKKPKVRITADMIATLLHARHSDDIRVDQCKTGASWTGPRVGIMDFWAMKRSWTSPDIFGYEIKVSRADFIRDDKWMQYLDYCNLFYFAAPQGIIEPGELPDNVGLVVASVNCKKMYLKKKAAFRDVPIPKSLWRYLLMWRTKTTSEHEAQRQTRKEFFETWMKDKQANKIFGWQVSRALAATIKERIEKVDKQNTKLEGRINQLEKVEAFCRDLDINPYNEYDVERKIREKLRVIPDHFIIQLTRMIEGLQQIKDTCKRVEEREDRHGLLDLENSPI